jgi:hypothetical protein
MERNQRSEWARGFEDLEVFRRAYRVSLEVHRASLEFPAIEQRALADQIRRGPNRSAPIWPKVLVGNLSRNRSFAGS